MGDLLTRIELRVLMEQEVINHQGDDAAAAAWTALRRHREEAKCVCTPERDEKGLGDDLLLIRVQ